jgi:hypothetical protein
VKFRALALCTLAIALAACCPLVMILGGKLSGTVNPLPGDWPFSHEIETIQLEARPSD